MTFIDIATRSSGGARKSYSNLSNCGSDLSEQPDTYRITPYGLVSGQRRELTNQILKSPVPVSSQRAMQ
jgi:hypothetical protein